MQYTQAQIDRANAVSLEDFLRTQGETLIKSGREYRWKEHDSLTIRGNKWFRHSQSKGGYPIDFVMEFYGKSFPEAVQLLTGESGEGQTEASTAPSTAFHLPLHNRTADRAIQYLCESRGLNKTLVEAFLLSGDIYEDAKRHNVVFVGRDRSGTPRYAHVRGTADTFRQDITGSDKSYPFRYEGNGNQLFVFEAPIDLLSFIKHIDEKVLLYMMVQQLTFQIDKLTPTKKNEDLRRFAKRYSEMIAAMFQTWGIPGSYLVFSKESDLAELMENELIAPEDAGYYSIDDDEDDCACNFECRCGCCGCCSDEDYGDEDDEDINEFAEAMAELASHIHNIFGNDVNFHIVID